MTAVDPFGFTDEELAWVAEHDPDSYRQIEALLAAELDDLRRHERPPVPGTPGALAAQLTDGREEQAGFLDIIDDTYVRIRNGEINRVMLFAPPQHGKSRRAARWAPLWYLSQYPDRNVIVVSYADTLAAEHGAFVRDTIEAHPELGLTVNPQQRARSRWTLAGHGGGMRTAGVGGPITGRPGDLIVVDDPLKNRQQAESPVERETLFGFYTGPILSRTNPRTAIVLIMTRWHDEDLAGRLLREQPGRWTVIRLPALADHDADGGEADPLGREPGDPLWPEHGYTREWYDDKRLELAAAPHDWASLYQQRPTSPEGAIWRWEWISTYRVIQAQVPPLAHVVVSVDPEATSGARSAETGIIVGGRATDGHGYLLDDRSMRGTPNEWGRAAWFAWRDHDADVIVYEQNQGGEMVEEVLRAAWADLVREGRMPGHVTPPMRGVHATRGKRIRAEPIAQLSQQGVWHHVGLFPELETQMTGWTGSGPSPDRLDAAVWLGHALFFDDGRSSPRGPVSKGERLAGRR